MKELLQYYGNAYTSGDKYVAFNASTGTNGFLKNGTWQNSATILDPENGQQLIQSLYRISRYIGLF